MRRRNLSFLPLMAARLFPDPGGRGWVDLKQFKSACRKYHVAQEHIKETQADPEAGKFIEIAAECGIVCYRSCKVGRGVEYHRRDTDKNRHWPFA